MMRNELSTPLESSSVESQGNDCQIERDRPNCISFASSRGNMVEEPVPSGSFSTKLWKRRLSAPSQFRDVSKVATFFQTPSSYC